MRGDNSVCSEEFCLTLNLCNLDVNALLPTLKCQNVLSFVARRTSRTLNSCNSADL